MKNIQNENLNFHSIVQNQTPHATTPTYNASHTPHLPHTASLTLRFLLTTIPTDCFSTTPRHRNSNTPQFLHTASLTAPYAVTGWVDKTLGFDRGEKNNLQDRAAYACFFLVNECYCQLHYSSKCYWWSLPGIDGTGNFFPTEKEMIILFTNPIRYVKQAYTAATKIFCRVLPRPFYLFF